LDAVDAILVSYQYDTAGRLSLVQKGGGGSTSYLYDSAGQVTSLINKLADGNVDSRFDYTYDDRGRRSSTRTLDGRWAYIYDGAGRLIRAVFNADDPAHTAEQDLTFSYDAVGNRTSIVANGSTTTYVSNKLNQFKSVDGVAFVYDLDGNLTYDGVNTYVYDQLNRLARTIGPDSTTSYRYDTFGRIVGRTSSSGESTEYVWDGLAKSEIAAMVKSNARNATHYVHGLGLVAECDGIQASSCHYYDFDASGSTVAITAYSGRTENRFAYDPYGKSLNGVHDQTQPFQFLGQWGVLSGFGGEGGYLAGERVYHADLGAFGQVDPARLGIWDVNLYRYANNNPIDFVDVDGRVPVRLFQPKNWKNFEQFRHWQERGERTGAGLDVVGAKTCVGLSEELGAVFASETLSILFGGIGGVLGYSIGVDYGRPGEGIRVGGAIGATTGALVGEWAGGAAGKWIGHKVCGSEKSPDNSDVEGGNGDEQGSKTANSIDPNEKSAGIGYGPRAFIGPSDAIPYRIDFENKATATAPAQRVEIVDRLSDDLDPSTLRLTEIGFGETRIQIPPGTQRYQTTRSLSSNGRTYELQIEVGLRPGSNELRAIFQSLDPSSGLPPDVLTGFLPPEDGTGRGRGYVAFSVRPDTGLATGHEIRNVAVITFDDATAIATNQVDETDPTRGVDPTKEARVTIDAEPPASKVAPLPDSSLSPSFLVGWTGDDATGGSGFGSFDIYV
ncbi:MAG TPA: RHS repeat-associated core domain-containing protein, partial [Pirellulaceae bacterium]|nr:RHS repeat-associated core domain-containing protein [Pirellulaceae bacterium]